MDYVAAIKVGYPLILSTGLEIIKELKEIGRPVIADLKVADIPFVSARICELARREGADYVIVQGFLGRDVIEACSKVSNLFVVADMSHPGALDFISDHNKEIAKVAKKYAAGIVAPATRPQTIKTLRRIVEDLIIISPGIKAQGADVGSAISAGADFEIVGRAIYNNSRPGLEAEKIYHHLKEQGSL